MNMVAHWQIICKIRVGIWFIFYPLKEKYEIKWHIVCIKELYKSTRLLVTKSTQNVIVLTHERNLSQVQKSNSFIQKFKKQ